MRFLFRRKGNKEDESNEQETSRPYSGLGIFSPLIKPSDSDPAHECRRLAELESIFIKSKRLESLEDVPYVVNQVRDGNIILLDISSLNVGKEQSQLELKRIIERIRGQTRSLNADIALINDECVIVTPSFVRF
ncbi:MAG: cell division protein SepF [Candidatus Thorarchaeota archaeon]|nr:MAG: cell division protein SepF [Candidatus Thorarchaeota archaeon]